jgi:Flp pilus assembly pilin Flp
MPLSIWKPFNSLWSKAATRVQQLDSGQGLVEYALILVLVAIVVIVVLGLVGNVIANTMYANIVAVL